MFQGTDLTVHSHCRDWACDPDGGVTTIHRDVGLSLAVSCSLELSTSSILRFWSVIFKRERKLLFTSKECDTAGCDTWGREVSVTDLCY